MRASRNILRKSARWGFSAASHLFARPKQSPFAMMFHSVDESGTLFSTSPKSLRLYLQYLREHGWSSLTSAEFVDAVLTQRAPDRRIFLTFDDGYVNFLTEAAPVLQEFGFTATVFVVPDLVGKCLSTHHRDSQYIRHLATGSESMRAHVETGWKYASKIPLMTWEQIGEALERGFDVHNHSANHHVLTTLSETELTEDLSRSRDELQRRLGKTIDLLCYPFGARDSRVTRIARATGHHCAVVADRFGTDGDPMQVSRFGMSDLVSTNDLAYFLSRGAQLESQLRTGLAQRLMKLKKGSDDSR